MTGSHICHRLPSPCMSTSGSPLPLRRWFSFTSANLAHSRPPAVVAAAANRRSLLSPERPIACRGAGHYRCTKRPRPFRRRSMASTQEATGTDRGTLQELARRHLWMHFTGMSAYDEHEIPIIVRGEGCYVYDEHGKRYLDGLSALFCVNIGHGRAAVFQAGA